MRGVVIALVLSAVSLGAGGCKKSGCERLAEMKRRCTGMPEPKIMRGQIEAEYVGACDAATEHGDPEVNSAIACAEAADDCEQFVTCLTE